MSSAFVTAAQFKAVFQSHPHLRYNHGYEESVRANAFSISANVLLHRYVGRSVQMYLVR